MIYIWDLSGVFVAAVSGGLAGRRKGMDWFGTFVVGLITGVGGGTLRSVLIGDVPPPVFKYPGYLLVALAATVTVWLLGPLWSRIRRLVSLVDAISLGMFVAIGVRVSQEHVLKRRFFILILGSLNPRRNGRKAQCGNQSLRTTLKPTQRTTGRNHGNDLPVRQRP
jgi:uncharacterized membrane protein YeiH